MKKIALLDDYQGVALGLADWASLGQDVDVTAFSDHLGDFDALVKRLEDFDIVCLMRERTAFPRALFERLPKLKLLVTTGMWNAAIDLRAAADHKVTVCGTDGVGRSTAELTWGLILALMRHIPKEYASVRAGGWQTTLGVDLEGKVLGLLGLGNIGSDVARVGNAFRMQTIAWSQNLTAERAAERGATLVTKEELFARADVLSIHLLLSRRTRGLVTRADLARMKPSAYFINTSRGPIVDEEALAEHLRHHRIAGAGLDVFAEEPLPQGHPFRTLDNVVATPHIGYVTQACYDEFYRQTLENIRAFLAGAPIRVMTLPKKTQSV